jgi:phosphoglycolate phosphatase
MFENRPFPEVVETIARLSRGHTLFIVTSKPWVFAEEIVARFDLEKYFWKVYGSELNGNRDEKADLLAYMLEREGLKPSRLLMIGDREQDVRGAKANGIACAGVLWGFGTRKELTAAGADYIVETPGELEVVVLGQKGNLA